MTITKGPATILEKIENNNYIILYNDERIRIHTNELMPYYH